MIPSSRDLVMGRIRDALGAGRTEATVRQRLATPPRLIRPHFAGDDISRFTAKMEASLCTVERITSLNDVPAAIASLLAQKNLEGNVSIAPSLRHLPWPTTWTINFGPGRRRETVAVTDALAGIAETGSLVICSEADRPASLNFLPDLHIAILRTADVVHHIEDIWTKVRALPVWPRAVNIISAPSRTADVAQIVVRPAHGPKELHVVLVEASP